MRDSSGRVLFFPAALLHSHLYYRYICSNRVAPQLVVLRSYIPEQIALTQKKSRFATFFFLPFNSLSPESKRFALTKKKSRMSAHTLNLPHNKRSTWHKEKTCLKITKSDVQLFWQWKQSWFIQTNKQKNKNIHKYFLTSHKKISCIMVVVGQGRMILYAS